jgi:cathepsin X
VKISRASLDDSYGTEINLSVQHLLNCGKELAGTCKGGHPAGAYQWIENNNIVFDTCQLYEAKDTKVCSAESVCMDCMGFGNCWAVEKSDSVFDSEFSTGGYSEVSISEHGFISGEKPMMKEIGLYGPIACGVDAIPLLGYSAGIISTTEKASTIDHVVSVVGWGVQDGVKYWEVR